MTRVDILRTVIKSRQVEMAEKIVMEMLYHGLQEKYLVYRILNS